MNAVHDSDRRIAAYLEEGTEVLPDWVLGAVRDEIEATQQRRPWWPMLRTAIMSNPLRVGILAGLIFLGLGLALITRPNIGSTPSPQPTPPTWSGPVRADAAGMPVVLLTAEDPLTAEVNGAGWAWTDGRDAALPWVDIDEVRWLPDGQVYWFIGIARWPPRAQDLDPDETVIEYGVVLDTNRDQVADYEFGINNDASTPGNFRVWLTDMATGNTDEHIGPPYGYPVEFSHPDEQDPNETLNGQPSQPYTMFTFLPGSRPIGDPEEWQFYVWASVTEGGEVVAWDYGPDFGWLAVPTQ